MAALPLPRLSLEAFERARGLRGTLSFPLNVFFHLRTIWERQGILHLGVCHSVDIFSLSRSEWVSRIVSHVTKSEREALISLVTIGADPGTPEINAPGIIPRHSSADSRLVTGRVT